MTELIVTSTAVAVLLFGLLWLILGKPSDAELHQAAEDERRRRGLEGLVERQRREEGRP